MVRDLSEGFSYDGYFDDSSNMLFKKCYSITERNKGSSLRYDQSDRKWKILQIKAILILRKGLNNFDNFAKSVALLE